MRLPRIFLKLRESGRVILTVGANLDFHLAEPVNPHLPGGNPLGAFRFGRDGTAVTNSAGLVEAIADRRPATARRLARAIHRTGVHKHRGSPARARSAPRFRPYRAGLIRCAARSVLSSRSTTSAKLAGRPISRAQSPAPRSLNVESTVSPVTYDRGTPSP